MRSIPTIIFIIAIQHILWCQNEALPIQWTYILGDIKETFTVFQMPDFTNGAKVTLPHRIVNPNRAMWYRAQCRVSKSSYLEVNADDGAQVWVDGKRVFSQHGYFHLKPSDKDLVITIRVLNNAVAGGLRAIQWLSSEQVQKIANKRNHSFAKLKKVEPMNNLLQLSSDTFTFSFWGDSQGGWKTFDTIVNLMAAFKDPLTIGLGDLTADGSNPDQWLDFNHIIRKWGRSTKIVTIPGNHDYDGYYDDLRPNLYFDYGHKEHRINTCFHFTANKCTFLTLDPNRNFPLSLDQSQLAYADSIFITDTWLNADWRFVLVHQPPYGQGWEGYDGDAFLREYIDSMTYSHKIDVVLSGHIHDYERISKCYNGHTTSFIVSGGAGGSLEPPPSNPKPEMDKVIKRHHFGRVHVTKDKLIVEIYDTKGNIIDRFLHPKIK